MVLVLLLPAPRLTELVVGEGLARAGDVGVDAVEDDAARDVLVEALVQEVAQHAPALRDADRDRGAGQPGLRQRVRIAAGVRRLVAQERDGVAHRREPESQHDGILRLIDELVDGAAVEPGGTRNLDLGVAHPGPREVRGRLPPAGLGGPDREHPARRLARGGRIGQAIAGPGRVVVEDHLLEGRADDGGAVGQGGDGQLGHDVRVRRRDVALPSHADQREPALEERALGRAGPAPVRDGVVEGPVPPGHVDGPVDLDGGAVLDPAPVVAGGAVEIDDVAVTGVVRVHLAGDHAAQALVPAGGAVRLAAEGRRFDDRQVDPGNLPRRGRGPQQEDDGRGGQRSNRGASAVRDRPAPFRRRCLVRGSGRTAGGDAGGRCPGRGHGVSLRDRAHHIPQRSRSTCARWGRPASRRPRRMQSIRSARGMVDPGAGRRRDG